MTSRRRSQTGLTRIRFLGLGLMCALLAACAALPDDAPVVENLDPETGATVARLGKPLELYRETALQAIADRFAFLGPFETNQMGERAAFLWVAVPIEQPLEAPVIEADGTALELGEAGRAADFAGLRSSPYRIPAPWSSIYYFRLRPENLERLAAADVLVIRTADAEGEVLFTAKGGGDARLREFAARP